MPGLDPSTYVDPAQPVSRSGDPGTADDSDILAMRCTKNFANPRQNFSGNLSSSWERRLGSVPPAGGRAGGRAGGGRGGRGVDR